MDPLSIAASAIALGQCAGALRLGIKALLSLRNSSDDFLSLLNELSLLHAFLERSRRTLAHENKTLDKCSSQDCGSLRLLMEGVENIISDLDYLAKSLIHSSKNANQEHRYEVSKRKWFCSKGSITKLCERSRQMRQDLGLWFAMSSASYGQNQTQLLVELRDGALSGLAGQFKENIATQTRPEGSPWGLERKIKDGLDVQLHLKHQRPDELSSGHGIGQTLPPPSAHDATYLPEDGNPFSTNHANFLHGGEILSVSMALLRHCPPSCQCHCHIKYRTHTPTWLRPVLGQILLQYNTRILAPCPPCNQSSCVSRDSGSIYFQFYLPRWLLPRAILASVTWDCGLAGPGASLHLRVPRVFEFDCGINMALIAGNITVIQQKFVTGALRPTDVDSLSGETVLTYAIRHGHPRIWHEPLNLGFDAGLKDLGSGRCVLDWVAQYGTLGAKLPTDFQADVSRMMKAEPLPRGQSTLIHDAIRDKCKADIHKAILQRPDDINKADGLGNAPLHLAVMLRDPRALKILLDYGADANRPNSQTCETPLHVSCGLQLYEISEILLNRGADPNRRDYRRRTALHHCPPLARFVRLLSFHGADVNARDTTLTSPLQLAMEYGSRFWRVDLASRRAFVKEMVRANADLELQNKWGSTPLLMAASFDAPMTPVLLELGAKVHSRGTIISFQSGVEDVNMLHVLALNPNARIPSKLTSLLCNFLGVDPDRSSSPTMRTSPLNILRNSLDINPAWGVADVLAFTKLIVGIREMNWAAGLFLESQRSFIEDGSHQRMKAWANAVSHLTYNEDESGCECLRRGSGWKMWWDDWALDDCCVDFTEKHFTPGPDNRHDLDSVEENEKESGQGKAEIFYDAVDY